MLKCLCSLTILMFTLIFLIKRILLSFPTRRSSDLGLRLAFVHVSATTVWPPTGIALAAFLLLGLRDRKSTRLNSSHSSNPYAVFCLIKKNTSIIHKKLFQFYSFIYLNVVKVHLFHL